MADLIYMEDLEEKLLQKIENKEDFDIEEGMLIAWGIRDQQKIQEYKSKIDEIQKRFETYVKDRPLSEKIKFKLESVFGKGKSYVKAKQLHNFLWKDNNITKDEKNSFDKVIDNFLNGKPVGSCVQINSLYQALGHRLNLDLSLMVSKSHVRSRLWDKLKSYDIENTSKNGFDCKFDLENMECQEKKALVWLNYENYIFNIYKPPKSLKNCNTEELNFFLKICNNMLRIFPNDERNKKNKILIHLELGNNQEAMNLSNKFLETNPDSQVYKHRAILHIINNDLKKAKRDLIKANKYVSNEEEKKNIKNMYQHYFF